MTAELAVALLIKATLLLAGAFAVDRLLGPKRVLAASAWWNAVLLALVALPVAVLIVPEIRLPVLPARAAGESVSPPVVSAPVDLRAAPMNAGESTDDLRLGNPAPPAAAPASVEKAAASKPRTRLPTITPSGIVALIYVLGVLAMLIRLASDARAVFLLKGSSVPVGEAVWLRHFDDWQARLGLPFAAPRSCLRLPVVQLLASDRIDVPIALGVLRRAIVVPSRLVAEHSCAATDAVLVHELAHIARSDAAWQLLERAVEAALWFHPLFWLARRRIAYLRERACDDFAIHALGDRDAYAETLLDFAARFSARRPLALGMAVVRAQQLKRRLAEIEHSAGNDCFLMSRAVRCAIAATNVGCALVLASAVAAQAPAVLPAEQEHAPRTDLYGDPLPQGALLRLGTERLRRADEGQGRRETSVSYSPDGVILACNDGDTVALWNAATGRFLRRLEPQDANHKQRSNPVEQVAFGPQGSELAAVFSDGKVILWDLLDGDKVAMTFDAVPRNPTSSESCRGFAYSPDGQMLAVNWGGKSIVFDKRSGKALRTLGAERDNPQFGLAWTPDGKCVAQGWRAPVVRLWNVERVDEAPREFNLDRLAFAISVAVSHDGQTLAAGCIVKGRTEIMICLWDIATGRLKVSVPSQDAVSVHFTPDDKMLVSATEKGSIDLWDVTTAELRRTIVSGAGIFRTAAVTADGRTMAIGSAFPEIAQWDLETGQKKLADLVGHSRAVRAVAYSPHGDVIATATENGDVRLWDAVTGQQHWQLKAASGGHLAFDPSGKQLASAGLGGGRVDLLDAATGERVRVFDTGQKKVRRMAFTPDGRRLVTVGSNSEAWSSLGPVTDQVHVWWVKTGQHIRQFDVTASSIESMIELPETDLLVLGLAFSEESLGMQAFDLETGALQGVAKGHKASVNALTGANGIVASASQDATIRLWNPATWEALAVLESHKNPIRSIAFSPDGARLVSSDEAGSVRLWDVKTRRQIHQFPEQRCEALAVCFSPSGDRVVAGMADSTALVWDARALQVGVPQVPAATARDVSQAPARNKKEAAVESARSERPTAATGSEPPAQPFRTHPITIAGTAVDRDGQPVAGATIFVITGSNKDKSVPRTATSGRDGRFELRDVELPYLPDDNNEPSEVCRIQLYGKAPDRGFVWSGVRYVHRRQPDPPPKGVIFADRGLFGAPAVSIYPGEPIDLRLEFGPAKTIAGRFIDTEGQPISGASVRMLSCDYINTAGKERHPNDREFWMIQRADTLMPNEFRVLSDAQGRFEFTGVSPDMWCRLIVSHPDYGSISLFTTAADRPPEKIEEYPLSRLPLEMTLHRVHPVTVKVKYETTLEPAVGARVTAYVQRANGSSAYGVADQDGNVTLKLPPGQYRLVADPPNDTRVDCLRTYAELPLIVEAGAAEQQVRLLAIKSGAVLILKAVDADTGAPLPNITFWEAVDVGDRKGIPGSTIQTHNWVADNPKTNDKGELRAVVVPGKRNYGVGFDTISLRGYQVVGDNAETGREIEVSVEKPVTAEFRLRKKAPAPDANAPRPAAGRAQAALSNDQPGAPAAPQPPVKPAAPEIHEYPLTVTGRAVGRDGKPIAGATIFLVSTNNSPEKVLGQTTSDPEGRYEFRDARLPATGAKGAAGTFQVFGKAPGRSFAWRGMGFSTSTACRPIRMRAASGWGTGSNST